MQKRQVVKSDSKPVKFFVVVEGSRGTNGRITSAKMVYTSIERPEVLNADQTCFAMNLSVPVTAFDPLLCEMKIQPSDLIPSGIIAEVESWIVEDTSERDSSD